VVDLGRRCVDCPENVRDQRLRRIVLVVGRAALRTCTAWFELVERRLGWDKKKAFDEIDKVKQDRIKKGLEVGKNRKGGRRA